MSKNNSTTLKSRAGYWAFINEEAPGTKPTDNPNETSDTSAPRNVMHHPEFFFDNVLIAIEIENTLFNVHRYQLTKSEVFSDMFNMPKPEGHEPEEGSSPEYPIVIKGVAASDFAALLKVLYASHFTSNQLTPDASLVVPAFRLANMFNFTELRAYLLPLAESNLGDVDKIVFAREFDIKDWLAPAHTRLCQREEPIAGEEARKLGIESFLIISRMREKHRTRPSASAFAANQYYCQSCAGLNYTSGSATCCSCDEYRGGVLYPSGSGIVARVSTSTTNDTAIEGEVKKWVEDGCVLKD